ncbi:MAG TPA: hypothetical protein VFT01_05485 [Homoserinimonas sp.]|nr:hypothetical protein [Homoserinimonas sp.]
MTESNPYVQQPYQPVAKKPPLSREMKRAASVAGAVSFTVMSIGWGLFSTAAAIGLFAGFFSWVVGLIGASGEGLDADYFRLREFIESINPGTWIIPLVIAGLVGIALWVWSLFISRGILARAKHPSPWGVTWAGAGIAIAASWFVSWVAWLPLQMIGFIAPDAYTSFESGVTITIVLAIVAFVLNLAISVVLGWLAWWWMAHAMRPATQPA